MRILIAALSVVAATGLAIAQDSNTSTEKVGSGSAHSTGQAPSDATNGQGGQMQPQGPTGPLNTTSGGAPAESPQGQTPPGMQSAPHGSDKTIVDEKKQ